jgi:hypothetical protein
MVGRTHGWTGGGGMRRAIEDLILAILVTIALFAIAYVG